MTLRRRVVSVIILAFAGLIPLQASLAQSPGSELTEEVAAHEVGDNAQVRLEDVAAFDPAGGEAIFEPGTYNEEAFSYDSVDAETNRLIGLTRAAPLDHPLGAFVEAVGQEPPPSAEPSPAPTESAEEAPSSSGGESSGEAPASETASDLDQSSSDAATSDQAAGEAPQGDLCVSNRPARECLDEIVGEICSEGLVCDIVGEILNDPCGFFGVDCTIKDPGEIIADPCGSFGIDCTILNPCDANNTGQTCEEYLNGWVDYLLRECEQVTDCDGALADCGLSEAVEGVLEETAVGVLKCLGETVPTTGLWIEPPIIIPLVEVNEDGSLHPCTVKAEIDEMSYNHGFLATNVDVHGDSHIYSDCRTLAEDLHAEVRITTSSRTQLLSPLGSSSSDDFCDSETPGTCNTNLLHQYPAADSWPSTISWRFYFSWEVPAHDYFIMEYERCYHATYPFGNINPIPCYPGGPTA